MGKKKKQEKLKKQEKKLKKQEKLEKQEKAAKKAAKLEKEKAREKAVKTENPGKPVRQTPKTRRARASSERNHAAAMCFRALGDENRLQILELLEGKELCAADILGSLSIVQSTLSHHMKILTEAGLVNVRKQGKWSYYSLAAQVRGQLTELIGQWTWTTDQKKR